MTTQMNTLKLPARSNATDWRLWCRVISIVGICAIAALQRLVPALHAASPSLPLLAADAVVYGAGKKVADLAAEHGLRERPFRLLGYSMALVGLVVLALSSAGATLLVADAAFHLIIKGKADNRGHLLCAVFAWAIINGLFAFAPTGNVDWTTVGIVLAGSVLWMWLNNRALRLGDNLLHQMRGDRILLLVALALANPHRWFPFALLASVESLAYGFTKIVAMKLPWYTSGDDVPLDPDPLVFAFHATPAVTRTAD